MSSSSHEILKYEYLFRLNRAIDYIRDHFAEELNLTKLAEVACFSKYHFHRIFRTLLGETVSDFVRRIRLEKAVGMLTLDKDKSIIDIALDCGFSSPQNFAKAFRAYFGATPTFVRAEYNWDSMRDKFGAGAGEDEAAPIQGGPNTEDYCVQSHLLMRKIIEQRIPMQVRVTEMPVHRVAYVRSVGPYRRETVEPAFVRLLTWAMPRGLVNEKTLIIGAMWSNPMVTPTEKCIYDACITVPESVKSDRSINIQSLPGERFAVYHCEIEPHEHLEAWMKLIIHWLLSSGYQPDRRPFYEIIYNFREEFPLRRHIVDLCLPVKPA